MGFFVYFLRKNEKSPCRQTMTARAVEDWFVDSSQVFPPTIITNLPTNRKNGLAPFLTTFG
jgi:hypothetical protein